MKSRAPRNRTITLSDTERERYGSRLLTLPGPVQLDAILDRTIHQNTLAVLDYLPSHFADLIFVDPPYNLAKQFNGRAFAARSLDAYERVVGGLAAATGASAQAERFTVCLRGLALLCRHPSGGATSFFCAQPDYMGA